MVRTFLEVKNLAKSYFANKKTFDALRGVSLTVEQGEVVALLGANGAGKTTLSSIVATLHPPTSGDITWRGRSIYSDLMSYRRIVGYCPQRPNLHPALSLRDSLLFAARFYGLGQKEAEHSLAEVTEHLALDTFLEARPAVLSGGWKQRFMLARALMHRPELLILDEPTVGLDPHIRRQLWDLIVKLKAGGLTVILTTHYLDEAEMLADRVVILEQGQVRLIDKPQNLKAEFASKTLEEVFLKLMNEEVKV